jgi:uncharacterized protein (TIGR02265 family)
MASGAVLKKHPASLIAEAGCLEEADLSSCETRRKGSLGSLLEEGGMDARAKPFVKLGAGPFLVTNDDPRIDMDDDWDALRARIELTPQDAQIRGMFLREVLRLEPRAAGSQTRYIPFSMYPVRDYMTLLLRAAQIRSPLRPPAHALLELGLGVYSLFASSLTGFAIFSVAQLNFARVCEVASRAYGVTLKPGRAELAHASKGAAVIQLRDVWVFPDIFHCGIWLGAMEACHAVGSIEVTRQSLCDVDLSMRWEQR